MNEKNIVLNNVEAAKEFVKAASECDFDIDVYFTVLAKYAASLSKRGCLKRNCCLGQQFFSVLCIFLLINKSFTVILDITLFYQYANVC